MPELANATLSSTEETSAVSNEARQTSSDLASFANTEAVTATSSDSKKETEAVTVAASSSVAASSASTSSETLSSSSKSSEAYAVSSVSATTETSAATETSVSTESSVRETLSNNVVSGSLHPVQSFSSSEEFATSSVVIDAYQYTLINRLDVIAVTLIICAGLLFFLVFRSINSSKR